jgi:hypothetical protein
MKFKFAGLVLISLFGTIASGCASIVNGQNQPVSIKTTPADGAKCALENNKGKWYVPATPGSTTVHRSFNDLNVVCEKSGYKTTAKKISSSTKGMAFGNILFGGVVGAGVDMANGSAYDYPNEIQIDMRRA